ncbi:hypothetical protein WICPIJ_000926 [Wickerhamomyces pijperi]|uniref:LisH domain-containing protein n=1 Tax=Wickerhamomyces pijperi TaxID=599730 RepID=A0A9P8TRA6_WICPI|nr:hypothetical protein WICPIJ_000926 [Wickerhamomyces pijperi]
MDSISLTDILIADYLQRKGFIETFKCFETDLNHTLTSVRDSTIKYEKLEDIITDRVKYLNMPHEEIIEKGLNSLNLSKNSSSLKLKKWSYPCVDTNKDITDLIGEVLVIHLSAETMELPDGNGPKQVLFVTTNDKKLSVIDLEQFKVLYCFDNVNKHSIGKCCYGIPNTDTFLSCGMDGVLRYFKIDGSNAVELTNRQLHKRLITDFQYFELEGEGYVVSIGWDSFIKLHKLSFTADRTPQIVPVAQFKLLSNATALQLAFYNDEPIFIVTRLDSTQLAYFTALQDTNGNQLTLHELIKVSLNDAEFSTHGFTPMSITVNSAQLNDSEPGLVAVSTSHVPYLRVIITKTPSFKDLFSKLTSTDTMDSSSNEQQLSTPTIRGHILQNYTTTSPQDKFSQSKVLWRLDQSGIWIMGDDGVIRGMECQNGQIVEKLINYEDNEDDTNGSRRIKNMIVTNVNGKEIVVSSGIDKKLNYWS